jgi:hypothetical protein
MYRVSGETSIAYSRKMRRAFSAQFVGDLCEGFRSQRYDSEEARTEYGVEMMSQNMAMV